MPLQSEQPFALPTAIEINDFCLELETNVKFLQDLLKQLLGADVVTEWEQIGAT